MSISRFHARIVPFAALCAALLTPLAASAATASPDDAETLCKEGAEAVERWVGLIDPAICKRRGYLNCECPLPDGLGGAWQVRRLFELQLDSKLSSIKPPIPPALASYCLYQRMPGGLPGATFVTLQQRLKGIITAWDKDITVIAPLSDWGEQASMDEMAPPVAQLRSWLREDFSALGRGGLIQLPEGPKAREDVEIAILDSSPSDLQGKIPRGQYAHGHVVGWTVRDLLCDPFSAGCFGHISTYLTLPYVDVQKADCARGGSFGTRADLAQQIFRAVETWKLHVKKRPRLVIPLALGWDPEAGPPTDTASRAVHDALVHAACHGAFLAAAAGNDVGGMPPREGPLYPAAWETEAAPTVEDCLKLEGVGAIEELVPDSIYPVLSAAQDLLGQPLLLSIGGVDRRDRPIVLTRPKSLTQLVALAFQADAGDPGLPPPSPLTGTSIAVAVAGAAAAAAWAYDPSKTAVEVMATLIATASPLQGIKPFLCAESDEEGYTPAPRRISLCNALAKVCTVDEGEPLDRCPKQSWECQEDANSPCLFLDSKRRKWFDAYFSKVDKVESHSAESSVIQQTPTLADASWVMPQPGRPGCTVCSYSLKNGLYADLQKGIESITLTLFSEANGSSASFTFPSAGQSFHSELSSMMGSIDSAMVSWTLNGASGAEQIAVTK